MIKLNLVAAVVLLVLAGSALAAENLGVTIYPGAKYDEVMSKLQAQVAQASGGGSSTCYRTKDPVAKVTQFYQKEGFKPSMGAVTEDDAMLKKGDSLNMRIKNMKSLDNTNDSSICILKK